MSEHSSKTSHSDKWQVRQARCACHRPKWFAILPGCEREIFDAFQLALSYAVDPRFRARWKAGRDLASQTWTAEGSK